MSEDKTEIIPSSGNVYADLGFENAEEMQAKSRLVTMIGRVMRRRGLIEAEVADALNIQPSEVYRVRCGHFEHIPVETLQEGLRRLSESGGGQGGRSGGTSGGVPLAAAGAGER